MAWRRPDLSGATRVPIRGRPIASLPTWGPPIGSRTSSCPPVGLWLACCLLTACTGMPSGGLGTQGDTPGPAGAAPSPAPTPVASATQAPSQGPHALRVEVEPVSATIYVAAPRGKVAAYPSEVKLKATVHLSDGSSTHAVIWHSSEGDRATVRPDGTVRAGLEAGEAKIVARSVDGRAEAIATIRVRDDASAEVAVE